VLRSADKREVRLKVIVILNEHQGTSRATWSLGNMQHRPCLMLGNGQCPPAKTANQLGRLNPKNSILVQVLRNLPTYFMYRSYKRACTVRRYIACSARRCCVLVSLPLCERAILIKKKSPISSSPSANSLVVVSSDAADPESSCPHPHSAHTPLHPPPKVKREHP